MKFFVVLLLFTSVNVFAQDSSVASRKEIVYGRKDGMALMMYMESPNGTSNKKAIISIINGSWRSGYESMLRISESNKLYTSKGYTVFSVITSSQPRYAIPDEVDDVKRAVRFIRFHAADYGIDPAKIGITGASSGGHLALVVATADEKLNPDAPDPVDRVSSRVQAVAVFYPPTDFLNFGQKVINSGATKAILIATGVAAAFDFKKWNDTTRTYTSVTDDEIKLGIAKQNSPIYAVSSDDPPVLIIHGDADRLVPIQQSESIIEKFKEAKVPNSLIVKKGGGHGWRDLETEQKNFVDWFDRYLQ